MQKIFLPTRQGLKVAGPDATQRAASLCYNPLRMHKGILSLTERIGRENDANKCHNNECVGRSSSVEHIGYGDNEYHKDEYDADDKHDAVLVGQDLSDEAA